MELMKELSLAPGVSSCEEEVAKIITRELKDVADDIETDSMGNLIATKKGEKKAPKVMLAAHMDEIGLKDVITASFPSGEEFLALYEPFFLEKI